MKKMLFLIGLFTLCATVTFAQDRSRAKAKSAKPSGWRDDSLLWVKKPVNGTPTVNNPNSRKPQQDKLGNFEIQDIKSPRDAASGQATGQRRAQGKRRGNQ
jgi:hypothetical protein